MRLNAVVVSGIAAALALAAAAAPAAAHPLGDPQTVRLSAEGREVTALWTAAADDLLVLGSLTGAIKGQREYVFDLGAGGDPEPLGDTDADLLMASAAVADYLAANITVTQDGRDCPAEVDLSGLIGYGAELVFTCDRAVSGVDVAVTVLTDVDPAYRTVAFAEAADREQYLYAVDTPSAAWRFDARAERGSNWAVPVSVGAVLMLVVVAGVLGLRRLRSAARS